MLTLDPLRLLDEIRAVQHHIAGLASRDADLDRFLPSLATPWTGGEVRPTRVEILSNKPLNKSLRVRRAQPILCEWLAHFGPRSRRLVAHGIHVPELAVDKSILDVFQSPAMSSAYELYAMRGSFGPDSRS